MVVVGSPLRPMTSLALGSWLGFQEKVEKRNVGRIKRRKAGIKGGKERKKKEIKKRE